MAYVKLIKSNPDSLASLIEENIKNGIRIHTNDIHYAIRNCDKNIIELMIDNIPISERYPCLYGAVVKKSRSVDLINLLHEKQVPLDGDIISYCIITNKIQYIEEFIKIDPLIITASVMMDAMGHRDIILYLIDIVKQHNIIIRDYELVMDEAYKEYYGKDQEMYELIKKVQDCDFDDNISYEDMRGKLYYAKSTGIIKQNTQVKKKHIVMAIEQNCLSFLIDLLPKYNFKISDDMLLLCHDPMMIDVIEKHNETHHQIKK